MRRIRSTFTTLASSLATTLAAALALALALAALAGPAVVPLSAQDAPVPPQVFDWFDGTVPATTPWGQQVDVESTRQILSWTTAPEYTNPMVDHLPAGGSVVSPTGHFGHPIGRPGVLHRTEEVHGYMAALARSTERVRFQELGETEEGNRLALVQVGSAANLARLDEIRAAYNRLADPRVADRAEAERLIADLPVIYMMTAGLHSPETGPPEMVMELAYRLAVSDDPAIRTIRDSVVAFIVPVSEPDGRNRLVDWYRLNYPTPDTTISVSRPPYWGKYIYHDNNRDGLQLTARLTQEIVGLVLDWKIPFAHDLHESVPYLYTSTGTGPYNPTVDAITVAEWTWFANYEVTALTSMGMPGVWTHGFYDGWNPTYLIWSANTRNGMGRFYETFGNSVPWTRERTLGGGSTGVEWYRPNPPRDTTMWSLRNNTNYMQTGVLTALNLTAQNRSRLLRQYRTKAENSLRQGRTESPYAYVVPAEQTRKGDAAYMLNLLRRQGIEVHRATDDGAFAAEPALSPARSPARSDADSPAGDDADDAGSAAARTVEVEEGDYVIRMDQPYRNLVLTLMQVQNFPENAPRPYDDVAWTFPLMFGATVRPVTDAAIQRLRMEPVRAEITLSGTVAGRGDWWAVKPSASAFTMPARLELGSAGVWAVEDSMRLGRERVGPGAWLVRASEVDGDRMRAWAARHGLDVVAVRDRDVSGLARHELDLPRIALLHSWRSTQPEGWVRYTFDTFGVPYTYVAVTELAGMGRLRDRFDVLVFPDQGGDGRSIFEGLDPDDGPLPYRSDPDHPSLGFPDATDDMTGGMRLEGLAALRDFVDQGGTYIGLRAASALPLEMGLIRGMNTRDTPSGLFVPGSLVRGTVARDAHPLAYGYGETVALHHRFGPYFSVPGSQESTIVLRYASAGDLFLSGLVQSPGGLARQPALLSVPSGDGHYVLFGFNPLNRHQNFMNFALVWNAIMNWNDLDSAADEGAAVTDGSG